MNENRPVSDSHISDPETWVDRYGDYLYMCVLTRIQDTVIAQDLVQETLLAALQARENFKGHSSERTWLTAILKHKIVDHLRKKSREQPNDDVEAYAEFTDELFDEKGDWREGPTKWSINPAKLLEQKEFWKIFYHCLSELPTRLAHAFRLREMDGLSTKEICNVLNVSSTNYWVMIYRARMHMRRCLEIKWFNI